MNYAPVTDLLRKPIIKTENQFIDFSDSSWQDYLDTGRSTGAYIIFYQGGKFTTVNMFQDQFLNQVQKLSTMEHALQEWI